jgi:hypothetical protein
MKKPIAILLSSYFVLASATVSFTAYQAKTESINNIALSSSSIESTTQKNESYGEDIGLTLQQVQPTVEEKAPVLTATISADNTKAVQPKATASKQVLSRGGSSVPKAAEQKPSSNTANNAVPSKGSVEVLDWWKQAKNVFKIGTTAVVQDVRTGKTFKIERTMGSNHADCEAASKADADIIKSIWGGFSWDVRPVIVNVGGRRLAASMSSLPHAGVDSAPAFATVDNRSEGYGRGENLDVIKNNGMNGHFDVHFLNSTRHEDGQVDPRHQAAIKIAAKQ